MKAWPVIALLDPVVANQIAAGEVVERPASVVKELVENSLDAGATRVQVRLQEGGRKRIQVTDNGHGLDADSARLAFARHATSKLVTADDLGDIRTYGFRGEALASILAVSEVTLTSRRADMAEGVRLRGGGANPLQEEPAGCPVGTDLVVADLFANIPARLKFLRTASTELGQVLRYLDALALARPELHLTLHHNERKVFDYPPDPDLARRAHAVLGREVASRLHAVPGTAEAEAEAETDGYAVTARLSDPGLNHAGPGQLVLLVNGRSVSDRTLQHAIVAAYGTLLERGRYPVGILSLRCPPETVDVNVHPAKTEVRFVSSPTVHAAVTRAVRTMLAATPWLQSPGQDPQDGQGVAPLIGTNPSPDAEAAWAPRSGRAGVAESGPSFRHAAGQRPWSVPQAHAHTANASPPQFTATPAQSSLPGVAIGTYSRLRYVGQVGLCFLVCEDDGAMVLIDQHAAHERILYENFIRAGNSGSETRGFPSQAMLIPVAVPLAPAEVAVLDEARDLLDRLGFDLEVSGERMVRLRAHPTALRGRDLGAEVQALAASLLAGGRGQATTERLERTAATLACHAAVRGGDVMQAEDVQDLLRQMDAADLAGYCPHGRPAVMRARFEDIGRWFHRP